MADRDFIMNLAKLVIAAAWVDGKIGNQEVNCLKDLLFRLPEISGEDWTQLEIYMESPVGSEERDRLLGQVLEGIRSPEDKKLLARTLTDLVEADGRVTEEEASLLETVKRAVEEKSTGLLSSVAKMIRGAMRKRDRSSPAGPDREIRIDDYIRNTVYFQTLTEMKSRGMSIQLPDEHVRKLCLAAGLMGRVAWVDREISEEEKTAMVRELRNRWGLNEEKARLVTDMSLSRVMKGLDHFRLCRSFFQATTPEERKRFLECLFQVARASEKISHAEIVEIRKIADSLKVPHRDFIDVKLEIPREDRGGM